MAGELKHVDPGAELSKVEYENTSAHVLDSQAQGDIIVANGTTGLKRLAADTAGKVLKTKGAGADPVFENVFPLCVPNDYTITKAGTSESVDPNIKTARFIVNATYFPIKNMYVLATLNTNNGSYTAYMKVYIDSEGAARLTLNTANVAETVVSGTFDVSDLTAGVHTITVKIYSGHASGTTTQKILYLLGSA